MQSILRSLSNIIKLRTKLPPGLLEKNSTILKQSFTTILAQVPEIKIDYISIAYSKTLEEVEMIDNKKLLISTAVFFNTVRLIDNFSYQSSR